MSLKQENIKLLEQLQNAQQKNFANIPPSTPSCKLIPQTPKTANRNIPFTPSGVSRNVPFTPKVKLESAPKITF